MAGIASNPISVNQSKQYGDQKALDKLIKHNLRFVVYVVRKMTYWKYGKMPLEDLLAMGNEQLTIAARRWTPTNNARFATYAKSFIEKGIRREMDNTAIEYRFYSPSV